MSFGVFAARQWRSVYVIIINLSTKACIRKETRPVLRAVIGREGKGWKIRIAVCARETDIFV